MKVSHIIVADHSEVVTMSMRINVVSFCFYRIPSAVLGIIKPLEVMQKQQLIDFWYANSMSMTKEAIDMADMVICIRGAEPIDLEWVLRAKEKGKQVIYYLDDDLLNINSYIYMHNRSYFEREDIKKNIKQIMSHCDYLWTSNQRILDKYKSYFRDGYVMKTPALLLNAHSIVEQKPSEHIAIGFAGGIDHRQFYERMLYQPIRQMLVRFSDKISFEIFGFQPYLFHHFPITHYPYIKDYDSYMMKMKSLSWDIALAPLPDTSFHACKHFNKYLEYGALKIPGIYSNVSPYKDIIVDGVNGLLVENTVKDWVSGVKRLIENEVDRREIAQKAYDHIKQDYLLDVVAKDMYQKILPLICG